MQRYLIVDILCCTYRPYDIRNGKIGRVYVWTNVYAVDCISKYKKPIPISIHNCWKVERIQRKGKTQAVKNTIQNVMITEANTRFDTFDYLIKIVKFWKIFDWKLLIALRLTSNITLVGDMLTVVRPLHENIG